MSGSQDGVRLAELLVGLSGVADMGMGLPVGSAARVATVAVELARGAGVAENDVAAVYYAALLQHMGCTAYSHEVSALYADEHSIKLAGLATDFTRSREIVFGYLPRITAAADAGEKLRTLRSALLHSRSMTRGYQSANCETAALVAEGLGLTGPTRDGLLDVFEWWNGGGGPRRLRGEQISVVARVVNIAGYAVFFDRLGGPDAARAALDQRSGGYLDPALVADFLTRADDLLAASQGGGESDQLLAAEPRPHRRVVGADALEDVLQVFGDAVDLKTPFLHGHSSAVSRLTDGACRRLGLDAATVTLARQAALVQDIGRAAVPSSIWEHTGSLGSDAWQQVRLHSYHSEQVLCRSPSLVQVGRLAGLHHERLDGSGYHRGVAAAQLSAAARVLAAADSHHALLSERPHRAAYPPDRARAELHTLVRSGLLDGDAVAAVIADGNEQAPRRVRPAGLTDRQLDVLRLVARGLSNREVASTLVISPRTAERHVQDMYQRIGVSSRAAAAMFAMQHGLL